jgi:hypothetical protein
MVKKSQSVDSLITGIETIISSPNSSLTDDQISTLQQCIELLNASKTDNVQSIGVIVQVISLIYEIFK